MENWSGEIFTKKWVVKYCHVGRRCWCRIIETVDGDEVIDDGCIDAEMAGYLVGLQNWAMDEKKILGDIGDIISGGKNNKEGK
jgi:hypothetical protein